MKPYLNTSYVDIKLVRHNHKNKFAHYLNTSYVDIKPSCSKLGGLTGLI